MISCRAALAALLGTAAAAAAAGAAAAWEEWIARLGHDDYRYPRWLTAQTERCLCSPRCEGRRLREVTEGSERGEGCVVGCTEGGKPVRWREEVRATPHAPLRWCLARAWLLEHMPAADRHFLPPAVAAEASSMLDDQIAFALMADATAPWARQLPLNIRLAYGLPYAGYHESRQNWRPLLFAKFFALVHNASSVAEAMARLLSPNVFTHWSEHYWPSSPRQSSLDASNVSQRYELQWASSTAPPVIAPLDFVAYGDYFAPDHVPVMPWYTARDWGASSMPDSVCQSPSPLQGTHHARDGPH